MFLCYFFVISIFMISYSWEKKSQKDGFFSYPNRGRIERFEGEGAEVTIKGVRVFGGLLALYTIFLTVSGFYSIKNNVFKDIRKHAPSFVICPNCLKTMRGRNVPNYLCPECNVLLENIVGFYDRHPDLLPQIESKRDADLSLGKIVIFDQNSTFEACFIFFLKLFFIIFGAISAVCALIFLSAIKNA